MSGKLLLQPIWRKGGCLHWWLYVITTNRSKIYWRRMLRPQVNKASSEQHACLSLFYKDKITYTRMCAQKNVPRYTHQHFNTYPWGVGLGKKEDKGLHFKCYTLLPGFVCTLMHVHIYTCTHTYTHNIYTTEYNIKPSSKMEKGGKNIAVLQLLQSFSFVYSKMKIH